MFRGDFTDFFVSLQNAIYLLTFVLDLDVSYLITSLLWVLMLHIS